VIQCHVPSIHANFLFGLFFYAEDGSDMFLRIVGCFQRTTRLYIPENITFQNTLIFGVMLDFVKDCLKPKYQPHIMQSCCVSHYRFYLFYFLYAQRYFQQIAFDV
jgi:hypothetical protein